MTKKKNRLGPSFNIGSDLTEHTMDMLYQIAAERGIYPSVLVAQIIETHLMEYKT